tara:strand:- start:6173 stop:6523 length:351 start_codon:yes stop_codon:yes gene_type:complete
MKPETIDLFKKANYRQTQKNQLELLKELKQERLTIGYNGGLFDINPTLINLVSVLENKKYTKAVIDDRNNNPIEIEVKNFMKLILDTYVQEQNYYLAEYNKIVTARSVEEILTYDD